MTAPTTPIDEVTRQWMAFRAYFETPAGFIEQYENTLASIWHSKRDKRGLKTLAYEATETFYQYVTGNGRKYNDFEVFKSARSRCTQTSPVKH